MTLEETIERLNEHAEWAVANEWETPITLSDDLLSAIQYLIKYKKTLRMLETFK